MRKLARLRRHRHWTMAAICQRDGCLFSRIKMRGNAQCYELEASIGRGERASVESSSSNAVYRSGFSNLAPRGWQLRMLVTSAHSTNQLPPFFGSIPSPVNFEVHAQPCDKPSSVSSGVACLTELHCLDVESPSQPRLTWTLKERFGRRENWCNAAGVASRHGKRGSWMATVVCSRALLERHPWREYSKPCPMPPRWLERHSCDDTFPAW